MSDGSPVGQALACDPARIGQATRKLPVIDGGLPDLVDLPVGCVFRPRCDVAIDLCAQKRPLLAGAGHCAACHLGGP